MAQHDILGCLLNSSPRVYKVNTYTTNSFKQLDSFETVMLEGVQHCYTQFG